MQIKVKRCARPLDVRDDLLECMIDAPSTVCTDHGRQQSNRMMSREVSLVDAIGFRSISTFSDGDTSCEANGRFMEIAGDRRVDMGNTKILKTSI